ncbi:MAG TPA: DUF2851 family protein [Verrucomicrobiae bacterium]
MAEGVDNFYEVWRRSCRALMLRDENGLPPEKLVQSIWQQQRLRRAEFKTVAGQALRVLHPGFRSAEGGPDFQAAVIQFAGEAPISGAVEVDLQTTGWHAHGHDINPSFKGVILHVVWEAPKTAAAKSASGHPVLVLQDYLDAPLAELALALEQDLGLPEALRGKCAAPLRELSPERLTALLLAAAKVRFQTKAETMLARARQTGWEQVLWEFLFRALGYKNNIWPMLTLAETRARWQSALEKSGTPATQLLNTQARLLGVSGLLPVELTRSQKAADSFLRQAWDIWWRERDALADCTLPRALWHFHGMRPANHPQRRLALAAHWLSDTRLIAELENWISTPLAAPPEPPGRQARQWLASLQKILQVPRDEYWSWHWTFNSARLPKAQPLLGAGRVTDLAINVILPWLWLRAREGKNQKLQQVIEYRLSHWPAAEDNAILKLARQRLLGTSNAKILPGAAGQQGLMQIVRDFCEHSNAVCADCRFPDLVRSWSTGRL